MHYSQKLTAYFLETIHAGSLEGEDVRFAKTGDIALFDCFCLYLKIQHEHVIRARFQASTTPALIAAGEYVCRWLEGKTLSEARSLQKGQILRELELEEVMVHVVALVEAAVTLSLRGMQ